MSDEQRVSLATEIREHVDDEKRQRRWLWASIALLVLCVAVVTWALTDRANDAELQAATTASQSAMPASWSEEISQASPASQRASGSLATRASSAALSMMRTWCPFALSSRAMERPTLPPPAMTTRMLVLSVVGRRRPVEDPLDLADPCPGDRQMEEVAVLVDGLAGGDDPLTEPGEVRDPRPRVGFDVAEPVADPHLATGA